MTAREVFPISKEQQTGRVWVCKAGNEPCTRKEPCRSCLGRRNRRSGMTKQREARKSLEALTGAQAARFSGQLGNEESWHGLPFRVEVKSGGVAKPVQTFYDNCEAQSTQNHAIGDRRPFIAVAMPKGGRMFLVIDNELLVPFVEAVVEALGNS